MTILHLIAILLSVGRSMHMRMVQSFIATDITGAPYGEFFGWMYRDASNSINCLFNSTNWVVFNLCEAFTGCVLPESSLIL